MNKENNIPILAQAAFINGSSIESEETQLLRARELSTASTMTAEELFILSRISLPQRWGSLIDLLTINPNKLPPIIVVV